MLHRVQRVDGHRAHRLRARHRELRERHVLVARRRHVHVVAAARAGGHVVRAARAVLRVVVRVGEVGALVGRGARAHGEAGHAVGRGHLLLEHLELLVVQLLGGRERRVLRVEVRVLVLAVLAVEQVDVLALRLPNAHAPAVEPLLAVVALTAQYQTSLRTSIRHIDSSTPALHSSFYYPPCIHNIHIIIFITLRLLYVTIQLVDGWYAYIQKNGNS